MSNEDLRQIGFTEPRSLAAGLARATLAARAVAPGLRLLTGTLQVARGLVGPRSPAPRRPIAPARIHFPPE